MGILPYTATIIGSADQIHRATGYVGGRLSLARVLEVLPGFLLSTSARSDPCELPRVYTVRNSGCMTIVFNPEGDPCEQRVRVAHELGHALLHLGHIQTLALPRKDGVPEAIRERQADLFAVQLLCPMWAVELALQRDAQIGWPSDGIPRLRLDALAAYFDLPRKVMEQRVRSYFILRNTFFYNASA